jgi:hypothetical protein
MSKILALVIVFCVPALAADSGAELLGAAKRGQADKIAALLAKGAPVDATDKDGRTALMLAAQHGHPDVVARLLQSGAKLDLRDRQGWTAYGLAVISLGNGREAVLKVLPPHAPLRLLLESVWSPDNLVTSCFLRPPQLREQVAAIQPDAQMAVALRAFAEVNGKRLVEFVPEGGDATLKLTARPAVSCVTQQSADNVNLTIEARLTAADGAELLDKTFGGGLKGLHARSVTSPAQYGPVYEEWAKAHAGEIFWTALESWLRRR